MNDDELRRRLGELADNQPWVVDWTTGVRRQVARRRRRQAAVLAGVTALVIAAGTGIGLAVTGPGGSQTLKVVSPPSGSPSPSALVHATPSVTSNPACPTSRGPCPSTSTGTSTGTSTVASPGGRETTTRSPTPRNSTTPSRPPSPSPTPVVNHVSLTISVSPSQPAVGQTATITVRAHGSAGFVLVHRIDFGDGTMSGVEVTCAAPSGTPSPSPREDIRTFSHPWTHGGQFTITAQADAPCSPYHGSATGSQVVTVRAAGSPSPTAAASPPG